MKLTLMAAISLDGFITRHDRSGSDFTSPEDKAFFQRAVLDFDCLILGGANYRQSSRWVKEHLRPEQLTVVVTRSPGNHQNEQQTGRLEFSSQSPADIVSNLAARGYRNGCLLGGGQIYGLFLAAGVVDELWLTLEPLLFGEGVKLAETRLDFRGELISQEKLNASTLLLKYRPV
jgi:dihydrofolate reductase